MKLPILLNAMLVVFGLFCAVYFSIVEEPKSYLKQNNCVAAGYYGHGSNVWWRCDDGIRKDSYQEVADK